MCSSIREFGFKIPCLARSDGEVVDGHLRLKAAQKLGILEVPVIRATATVHSAELLDVIVDGGESAKSLNRPGLKRLLELLMNKGEVQAIIIAMLDRLTGERTRDALRHKRAQGYRAG